MVMENVTAVTGRPLRKILPEPLDEVGRYYFGSGASDSAVGTFLVEMTIPRTEGEYLSLQEAGIVTWPSGGYRGCIGTAKR